MAARDPIHASCRQRGCAAADIFIPDLHIDNIKIKTRISGELKFLARLRIASGTRALQDQHRNDAGDRFQRDDSGRQRSKRGATGRRQIAGGESYESRPRPDQAVRR
jgi:hypothetical protein